MTSHHTGAVTGDGGSADAGPGRPSGGASDGGASAGARVVLYSRVGCHLCDDARAVVAAVCGPRGEPVTEVDVDTDPELVRAHGDRVPVVTVDQVVVDFYQVDPVRLAARLDRPVGRARAWWRPGRADRA